MVAYAVADRYYGEEIREGASLRPRQKILSLPSLSQMQVKTSVHESVLDQVKPELSASVRVDAFPERLYRGTVKSVAVLPDQGGWYGSDTKVYQTIVTIDEPVERLKPGMTAVVEIHVDRLNDVVTVPVQAIVQVGKETACYVAGPTARRAAARQAGTHERQGRTDPGRRPGGRPRGAEPDGHRRRSPAAGGRRSGAGRERPRTDFRGPRRSAVDRRGARRPGTAPRGVQARRRLRDPCGGRSLNSPSGT